MALFKFNNKDSSKCLPFPFKVSFIHTTPQQTHKNAICPASRRVSQPLKTPLRSLSVFCLPWRPRKMPYNTSLLPSDDLLKPGLYLGKTLGHKGLPRWHQWWRARLPTRETQETWLQSPGREDPLEEETATHLQYSCLERSLQVSPWGHKESDSIEHTRTHIRM